MQRTHVRFRYHSQTYLIFPSTMDPMTTLHHRFDQRAGGRLVRSWLWSLTGNESSIRAQMVSLHQDIEHRWGPYTRMSDADWSTWLLERVGDGRLIVMELLPAMKKGQSFEEYARIAHVPQVASRSGDALPKASKPTEAQPYEVMPASGNGGLKTTHSADCPTPNFRSERVSTASAEMLSWLDQHVPRERWEGTLGENGGGGFMATTTRVVTLPAGTVLYRYFGGTANPCSTWWFAQPYEGDPRVFAALPEGASADQLVRGKTRNQIDVLSGIGAPRCSNKPGGPVQYFVPFSVAKKAIHGTSTTFENEFIQLI